MDKKRPLFQRVGRTPIIPISLKLLTIFICLILLSNFTTNFITIQLSQRQIITLTNTVLVDQLKEMCLNAGNQYRIYQYSGNREESVAAVKNAAKAGLSTKSGIAFAVDASGNFLFLENAANTAVWNNFTDSDALALLNKKLSEGVSEGSVSFKTPKGEYFGVYKYQQDWGCYLVRAELRSETQKTAYRIYGIMAGIIIVLTLVFMCLGLMMFRQILRNIKGFANDLYDMQQRQQLGLIDISKAPNDDITYLAASFNALSFSVNNLLTTFQKFVSKDVVAKAYSEHGIALEGSQRELTMLFSDIKSFTNRTETLGNEIIDVLNVHYDRVIHRVHENNGVVGSIIGDAILAVFGTEREGTSKSFESVKAAWDITTATAEMREIMKERRKEIEKKRKLNAEEQKIYEAVLIDVGVGIDGGNVFYGNIGSKEHMANTVIGDNVNSASRLEGLTRIYHLPVIVSDYIKDEVLKETDRYHFYEIDTVLVKGKKEGKKIFFPLDSNIIGPKVDAQYEIYEKALQAYYDGKWRTAKKLFKECELEVADVFLERIGTKNAPADWSGIWTMTTK